MYALCCDFGSKERQTEMMLSHKVLCKCDLRDFGIADSSTIVLKSD